jgi:hypothetical protein
MVPMLTVTQSPRTEEDLWVRVYPFHLQRDCMFIRFPTGGPSNAFVIKAEFFGHTSLFKVSPNTRFGLLRTGVNHRFGLPEGRTRIGWHGPDSDEFHGAVPDDATLSTVGITEESQIRVHWEQVEGLYSGVCLWSPAPQRVEVHTRLPPCWGRVQNTMPPAVETIVPRVDYGSDTDICWIVDVKDGLMYDVRTGRRSDVLHWEAP